MAGRMRGHPPLIIWEVINVSLKLGCSKIE